MSDYANQATDKPRGRRNMILRHDVLEAYPGNLLDGVPGVKQYGARILAMSYPGDIIMMPPALKDRRLLNKMLEHYERVGLVVASDFIFDEDWEIVKGYPDHVLDSFHFGEAAHAVAPDENFALVAEELNDKNHFIKFCEIHGIPTPGTVIYDSVENFSLTDDRPEYPVYVKATISASGMHVIRCENDTELLAAIAKMPDAFQIQEGLSDETVWCNIQYTEVGGRFTHGPLTLQKLVGNEHAGNIFPSGVNRDLVQPLADKIGKIMFDRGMKNTWAFDVAITPGRGALFIEVNPRWNGASYYSGPAERLGAQEWEGQYVYPTCTDFDSIFEDLGDWEYNPDRGSGIVFINWGPILANKLGLLVIGTPAARKSLLSTFQKRFC